MTQRRIACLSLLAALVIGITPVECEATGGVPPEIVAALTECGVTPDQVAVHYDAILTAISTKFTTWDTSLAEPFRKLDGLSGGPEARRQALELMFWQLKVLRAAVADNIRRLGKLTSRSMPLLKQLTSPENWRSGFRLIYERLAQLAVGGAGVGGGAAAAGGSGGGKVAGAAATSSKAGFASLPVLWVTLTALISGTSGYLVGKAELRQLHLETRAAAHRSYFEVLTMLTYSMRAGRAKLLPGVSMRKAAALIIANMQAGRGTFVNVLQVKPAPDIAGSWQGVLVTKRADGRSSAAEGARVFVKPGAFTIEQDSNEVLLRYRKHELLGWFGPEELSKEGSASDPRVTVTDSAVLTDKRAGGVQRAVLKVHSGSGAGALAGRLWVEFEYRTPEGASVILGGALDRPESVPDSAAPGPDATVVRITGAVDAERLGEDRKRWPGLRFDAAPVEPLLIIRADGTATVSQLTVHREVAGASPWRETWTFEPQAGRGDIQSVRGPCRVRHERMDRGRQSRPGSWVDTTWTASHEGEGRYRLFIGGWSPPPHVFAQEKPQASAGRLVAQYLAWFDKAPDDLGSSIRGAFEQNLPRIDARLGADGLSGVTALCAAKDGSLQAAKPSKEEDALALKLTHLAIHYFERDDPADGKRGSFLVKRIAAAPMNAWGSKGLVTDWSDKALRAAIRAAPNFFPDSWGAGEFGGGIDLLGAQSSRVKKIKEEIAREKRTGR